MITVIIIKTILIAFLCIGGIIFWAQTIAGGMKEMQKNTKTKQRKKKVNERKKSKHFRNKI